MQRGWWTSCRPSKLFPWLQALRRVLPLPSPQLQQPCLPVPHPQALGTVLPTFLPAGHFINVDTVTGPFTLSADLPPPLCL